MLRGLRQEHDLSISCVSPVLSLLVLLCVTEDTSQGFQQLNLRKGSFLQWLWQKNSLQFLDLSLLDVFKELQFPDTSSPQNEKKNVGVICERLNAVTKNIRLNKCNQTSLYFHSVCAELYEKHNSIKYRGYQLRFTNVIIRNVTNTKFFFNYLSHFYGATCQIVGLHTFFQFFYVEFWKRAHVLVNHLLQP